MADKKEKTEIENKYLKNELLKSNKFSNKVDILNVILKDDKTYSIEEVNSLIYKFLKGKVD